MKEGPDIARIASLIGEPGRANMLCALMSGKALTVSELAEEAGVTIQTASSHLKRLEGSGLLRHEKQGRHKYIALASSEVASVIEGLMGLAASSGHLRHRLGPKDAELRKARVCYDHLAGEMGILMYQSLLAQTHLSIDSVVPEVTNSGEAFARDFGIDMGQLTKQRTPVCRTCLDWSERESHLAGSLGRALLARIEFLGWAKRDMRTRVVSFSQQGEDNFRRLFPI